MATKQEIYDDYRAAVKARKDSPSVGSVAKKHGISRARLHQIVKEVEKERAGS